MVDKEDKKEINYNEGEEFFSELEKAPYQELNNEASKVLRGILRGQVMREALGNVLKLAKSEDLSLSAMDLLSNPRHLENGLRKQGQIKGIVLAIEALIEQAYLWLPEEENQND